MYTAQWYRDYAVELQRNEIRKVHDKMFELYKTLHLGITQSYMRTVDLGCATCEFGLYCRGQSAYAGLDLNRMPHLKEIEHLTILQADFTEPWPDLGFVPNNFVSLFASELMLSYTERELFYRDIFKRYPSIKTGLVAGLYYRGLEDKERINERSYKDGMCLEDMFVVHQTVQRPIQHPEFLEMRIETKSPYTMFGDNCVEVWRIFVRR